MSVLDQICRNLLDLDWIRSGFDSGLINRNSVVENLSAQLGSIPNIAWNSWGDRYILGRLFSTRPGVITLFEGGGGIIYQSQLI